MSIVEIDNLVKNYGENVAVDDLNLKIDEKGVYGFLGPNGAGKSTTMNIITGYIGATSGTVKINGFDIFKEPENAKKNIGYLPEMPPLYQDMTVFEYLDFVSKIKKIKKDERQANIEKSLEMTRTNEVRDRLIKNLSKGYKQRVGIAQAIMGMPELIILDEPTVGLDPKQIIEIRDLIKKLGEEHTVILSSHILTEISEVCEKIFIISQGKLVAQGTESELVGKLAGNNIIQAAIKGKSADIENILSKIEGDHTVSEAEDGLCMVEIVTERDVDVREELFFALAEQKLPIYEMRFKTKTLEDIFIELTTEYKAVPKKKRLRDRRKKDAEVQELSEDIEMTGDDEVAEDTKIKDDDIKEDLSDDKNTENDIVQEVEE